MTPGHFYMHRQSMDVCIEVIGPRIYGLLVKWWNLGYDGNPWPIDQSFIKNINEHEWVDITTQLTVKRTQSGLP